MMKSIGGRRGQLTARFRAVRAKPVLSVILNGVKNLNALKMIDASLGSE
jgi:hypothetical protein